MILLSIFEVCTLILGIGFSDELIFFKKLNRRNVLKFVVLSVPNWYHVQSRCLQFLFDMNCDLILDTKLFLIMAVDSQENCDNKLTIK